MHDQHLWRWSQRKFSHDLISVFIGVNHLFVDACFWNWEFGLQNMGHHLWGFGARGIHFWIKGRAEEGVKGGCHFWPQSTHQSLEDRHDNQISTQGFISKWIDREILSDGPADHNLGWWTLTGWKGWSGLVPFILEPAPRGSQWYYMETASKGLHFSNRKCMFVFLTLLFSRKSEQLRAAWLLLDAMSFRQLGHIAW